MHIHVLVKDPVPKKCIGRVPGKNDFFQTLPILPLFLIFLRNAFAKFIAKQIFAQKNVKIAVFILGTALDTVRLPKQLNETGQS